jgi:heme exporter protein A
MNPLTLKCEDLAHSFFGKTLFKDLSFELSSGDSLAITGKNGSGKSTLIKIIANLLRPVKGKVTLRSGENEISRESFYMHAGMSAPYLNLYDELTGLENLEFFSSLRTGQAANVETLLKRADIFDSRNKSVKNYSSGMKQRLKLCFALLNEPGVLLLDEPMTNLDADGAGFVRQIATEQKTRGILIIATNNPDEAALCSKNISIEDYLKEEYSQ